MMRPHLPSHTGPDLEGSRLEVAKLEQRLEAAKAEHRKNFPGNRVLNPQAQASLQGLGAIDQALFFARRHVANLELAAADRAARGFPPAA